MEDGPGDRINGWLEWLVARHTAALTRPEFLKAVRALSARYVERRADLPRRRAADSAGKRAAFAAFYGPLHFLIVCEIVRRTGLAGVTADVVLDLGCGTGVAGAAWALSARDAPLAVVGLDRDRWALDEARWNWHRLGVWGSALFTTDFRLLGTGLAGRGQARPDP
jgi:methylase of polypeptide subunit release factors